MNGYIITLVLTFTNIIISFYTYFIFCPCPVQHILQNFVSKLYLNPLQSCPKPPCIVIGSPMTHSTNIDSMTQNKFTSFI